jgi:hypothetical protein
MYTGLLICGQIIQILAVKNGLELLGVQLNILKSMVGITEKKREGMPTVSKDVEKRRVANCTFPEFASTWLNFSTTHEK